jgi:spoIIIJ-associated protein
MNKTETIKTEAEELLKKMIGKCDIEVEEEGEVHHVIIKTEEDAPTVIGRHGETIRAIQKILEVVLYKTLGEPVHLLVNVNDYREKQKERLQGIASEMAQKTQSVKRSTHLRGLSSYERKIVHEYVTSNYPELTTYSVGEGRDRHLVIDLKENAVGSEEQNEISTEE